MRRSFLFFVLFFTFLLAPASLSAQEEQLTTDTRLSAQVKQLIKGFKGDIGIYIKSLKTGKAVSINADSVFPTASIVKVPLLIGIMHKIAKGELSYHQKLTYADTLNYDPGEDILPYLKPGSPIELSKVMMLMMTISDNNASLWLQSLAGTGTSINALMDSLGYHQTRVNSRTPGREAFRKEFGWGQTTPREMARIFEDIAGRKVLSPEHSDKMLRIMSRQYWDEEALASIPPGVFVASKNGAVNASRSEVLYVNGAHPFLLSIFTKNNKDITWQASNEAWELTRKLASLCWKYFQ